jgi:hypothetical protein
MQKGYSETENGGTDNIMTKRTSHDLQKLHSKLKIEQHEPHKPEVNWGSPEELAVPVLLAAPVVFLSNDTNIMWYGNRVRH